MPLRPFISLFLLGSMSWALCFCGQGLKRADSEAPVVYPTDLSEIGGEWVELTATDSGWIIYETCDGGNMQMRLLKDNQDWALHFYGQQEDYTYWVDQQLKQEGSPGWRLLIHTDWDTTQLPLVLKPIPENPELLEMQFTSSQGYIYTHRLVKSSAQHKFLSVEQDCYECWGEGCDEFEH